MSTSSTKLILPWPSIFGYPIRVSSPLKNGSESEEEEAIDVIDLLVLLLLLLVKLKPPPPPPPPERKKEEEGCRWDGWMAL